MLRLQMTAKVQNFLISKIDMRDLVYVIEAVILILNHMGKELEDDEENCLYGFMCGYDGFIGGMW